MRNLLRNIFLNIMGVFKSIKPGVHIINAHYVTPNLTKDSDLDVFERFLSIITRNATLISLEQATTLIRDNKIPKDATFIALTFDDGFEECYTIIAPLIEKYGSTGAFFINANYIESDHAYQEKFNDRVKIYTKKPMSWSQLIDLRNRGHIIGSHNLDHTDMSELNSEELDFQLRENKKILENKLNYTCDYFAWTYGQMQHFPEKAFQKTAEYHKYIFSATNYKNYTSMNGKVLNRRHIEPFWSKRHMNYFLSVNKK